MVPGGWSQSPSRRPSHFLLITLSFQVLVGALSGTGASPGSASN